MSDLYRSEGLRVRLVLPPEPDPEVCYVTFDSFANDLSLDRPGFGEGYFRDRGFAAIHVLARENIWYQEPDLAEALAAVAAATAAYGRVFAYGSSMGAYAAIRFGGAAGAQTAIAISPQYSLDPRKVPFEIRWAHASQTIRFRNEALDLPRVERAYVFYDPRDPDDRHVALIAAEYPVSRVRLPYAGHPVGSYLLETGLLSTGLTEIRDGSFDARSFERRARAARRRSGQYLFTLARRLRRRHGALKVALARAAVAVAPTDPEYQGFLAMLLEHGRAWDEAGRLHEKAVADGGDQPLALDRYARHLLRVGEPDRAAPLAARAADLSSLAVVRRTRALADLALGRRKPALAALAAILRAHPEMAMVAAREVAAVIGWRLRGRPRLPASRDGLPPAMDIRLARSLTLHPETRPLLRWRKTRRS